MARNYENGLPEWTGTSVGTVRQSTGRADAAVQAPLDLPIAYPDFQAERGELCWLGDSPFAIEQQAWRGRPVIDCQGRPLGKVRDVLIEVRPLEAALRAGRPSGRGVRALYLAIRRSRPLPWRSAAADVLLPVRSVMPRGDMLQASVDAAELWPRLFGRVAPGVR